MLTTPRAMSHPRCTRMSIYHRSIEEQQADIAALEGTPGVSVLTIGRTERRPDAKYLVAVDDEWVERVLAAGRWAVTFQHDRRTAWAQNHRIAEFDTAGKMHRWMMRTALPLMVDHRNGNGLDNRTSNLRVATSSQNSMNRRKTPGQSSQYKGVWYDKKLGMWVSHIGNHVGAPGPRRNRIIGRFVTEQGAA